MGRSILFIFVLNHRQVVSYLPESGGSVLEDFLLLDFLLNDFGENDLEAQTDALLVQVPSI